MDESEIRLIWKRTVIGGDELRYDFTATLNGRTVGRIRRHWDEKRWMRSAYLADGTGRHGIVDRKQQAADSICDLALSAQPSI